MSTSSTEQTTTTTQPPAPAAPAAPARPDGVSETEWSALGDHGKVALTREREARRQAESELAAARARPTPPPGVTAAPVTPAAPTAPALQQQAPAQQQTGQAPDIAAIVQQAVAAAIAPFQERDQQREAAQAADAIRTAVTKKATDLLHDANDALVNVDLTTITDGNGRPDPAKIDAALQKLVTDKPYLAKPTDGRRFAASPAAGATAAPGGAAAGARPLEDRVKDNLAAMNGALGLKPLT